MGQSENDILRHYFAMTGWNTPTEFVRGTGSKLTEETYTGVLHRNRSPALRTLLIMAAELGCPTADIVDMLKKRNEHTVAKMIEPVDTTLIEKKILTRIRLIQDNPKKFKLMQDFLENLTVTES